MAAQTNRLIDQLLSDDPLLKVREVASMLRVSPMTVYRIIESGELDAIRIGRTYRVQESTVRKLLASGSIDTHNTKAEQG